jgi:hypothetical protein
VKTQKPNPQILKNLCEISELTNGRDSSFVFEYKKIKYTCSIKKKRPVRSLDYNAYYWVCLSALADYIGTVPDTLHDYYKRKYLQAKKKKIPKLGTFKVPGSTKGLDSKTFWEYFEKVKTHSLEFFGFDMPLPKDKGFDEMIEQYSKIKS